MKISLEKFKEFFETQEWSHTEIGASYGASQQTITNYLNGKRKIPLDFILWMKEKFPNLDLNSIFDGQVIKMVSEERMTYANEAKKDRETILAEIGGILDKYL